MQREYFVSTNGQEVTESDLNLVSTDAALADDIVFAELLRMPPYNGSTVSRGILPYNDGATIIPNGASGSVLVNPFHAYIGSNTLASTAALTNWEDIRSTVFVGGATSLTYQVSFSANSSGNNRWDLVYVRIDRDVNEANVTRYVKTSGPPVLETATSIAVVKNTLATIGVVVGTPAATPALPSIPSDSGGSYYIPLAYVRIPNGFTATSTVASTDILGAAPVINISKTTGVSRIGPANAMYSTTGAMIINNLSGGTWANAGTRAQCYMPPSMKGEDVLYFALNLLDPSNPANWSQVDSSALDTGAWTNRIFFWQIAVNSSTTSSFPWVPGITSTLGLVPSLDSTGSSQPFNVGMGQSFVDDSGGGGKGIIANLTPTNMSGLATSTSITIYVDLSSGQIKFTTNATFPKVNVFGRICASAPFPNK